METAEEIHYNTAGRKAHQDVYLIHLTQIRYSFARVGFTSKSEIAFRRPLLQLQRLGEDQLLN